MRSIDKVRGGDGDDTLVGSDRPELLQGAGGADAIAGGGGADLLIGDGAFVLPVASDAIDAGAGVDLVDLSNESFDPAGLFGPHAGSPPSDSVRCGQGNDRVDTTANQLVPVDCEGARFNDATTIVPLRPIRRADGSLVFDIPCPKLNAVLRPIGTCEGTLDLARFADRSVLGSSPFSVRGGTQSSVVVSPSSPVAAAEPVGVQIAGTFDRPTPDGSVLYGLSSFGFGWATTF